MILLLNLNRTFFLVKLHITLHKNFNILLRNLNHINEVPKSDQSRKTTWLHTNRKMAASPPPTFIVLTSASLMQTMKG